MSYKDHGTRARKLSSENITLRAQVAELQAAEKRLDDQLAIQMNEPSVKTDGYMAGLLNGMLLAKANFGHDYNPVSYKDSKLAELTEAVEAARDCLELFKKHNNARNVDFAIARLEAALQPTTKEKANDE